MAPSRYGPKINGFHRPAGGHAQNPELPLLICPGRMTVVHLLAIQF